MKGITGNPVLDAYQQAVKPLAPGRGAEPTRSTPSSAQAHPAAKVSLSAEAKALASGASSAADTERVEALKTSIASGTFHVDSQRVAEVMLSGSREP